MSPAGKTSVIDAACSSRDTVAARLAADLGFPAHAAHNLDALFDVLRTDIEGPIRILWQCPAAARAALGPDYARLRKVLEDVAAQRDDVTLAIDEGEAAPDQAEVAPLFDEATIARRVQELAVDIRGALPDKFTVVGLLKGAFVFTADLVRALDRAGCRPQVEFLQVSSYGSGTESSGRVKVIGGMLDSIDGRIVLLVDDIQDTGRTLAFTRDLLLEHGAAKVWTCALLDKPTRRVVAIEPDFVGFVIPDVFVVGYGIDFAEQWRHLPYIGKIG